MPACTMQNWEDFYNPVLMYNSRKALKVLIDIPMSRIIFRVILDPAGNVNEGRERDVTAIGGTKSGPFLVR